MSIKFNNNSIQSVLFKKSLFNQSKPTTSFAYPNTASLNVNVTPTGTGKVSVNVHRYVLSGYYYSQTYAVTSSGTKLLGELYSGTDVANYSLTLSPGETLESVYVYIPATNASATVEFKVIVIDEIRPTKVVFNGSQVWPDQQQAFPGMDDCYIKTDYDEVTLCFSLREPYTGTLYLDVSDITVEDSTSTNYPDETTNYEIVLNNEDYFEYQLWAGGAEVVYVECYVYLTDEIGGEWLYTAHLDI